MQRAVIIVRGRVQKVVYRDTIAEIANKMDITGIIENLPDGKSVKIIVEAEKDVLDGFIKLLWVSGDPAIKIKSVDVAFQAATGEYEFFDIVYEDFQKEAFERIGVAAMYLKQLNAGQNKMLEKQDIMLEKQDIIIEKLDDTGKEVAGEIREMREDLRSYLDRRLIRIEDDITKIKAKIDLS